jgi:hypothetical protein
MYAMYWIWYVHEGTSLRLFSVQVEHWAGHRAMYRGARKKMRIGIECGITGRLTWGTILLTVRSFSLCFLRPSSIPFCRRYSWKAPELSRTTVPSGIPPYIMSENGVLCEYKAKLQASYH